MTNLYYAKSTGGFYDSRIFKTLPEDAVEITYEQYDSLLFSQSNGKVITSDKNGFPIAVDPNPPTKEETIAIYEKSAQENLDSVAKSWGYDSLVSAASYANSTNAQFKAEAEALIAWRDSCWTTAYTIEAGTLPATVEAFVAALPAAPTKPVI